MALTALRIDIEYNIDIDIGHNTDVEIYFCKDIDIDYIDIDTE